MSNKNIILSNLRDSVINSENDNENRLINFDNFVLKDIDTKSLFRNILLKIVYFFQKHILVFLFFQYIIGFLFLGLPLLLYLLNDIKFPFSFSYLISIIVILLLCLFTFLFRIYDNKKHFYSLYEVTERNNIFLFIGIGVSCIIILIILIFFYLFENKINSFKNENIKFDSNGILCDNEDILFKFILIHYLNYSNSTSFAINFGNNNKDYIFKEIKKSIYYIFIPLLIFFLIQTVKNLLIKNKNSIEKFFIGIFTTIDLIIIYLNWENIFNNEIILKYAEIILPLLILIFILICVIKNLFKIFIKKSDNNFKIYKLPIYYILLSRIPDIILMIGIFNGIIAFVQCFYFLSNDSINQKEKILIFNKKIKILFTYFIIGYIFHFGHYFLYMLLGPIILKYCPSRLKNNFYIKINQNSAINQDKFYNRNDSIFSL